VSSSTARVQPQRRQAPAYRAFPARVERVERLSPHFARVTFGGADLDRFGYAGNDQRVKVLLPQPGRSLADLPTGENWYPRWRSLPEHVRPTMRTYTVRAFRREQRELDVDFVLHGLDDDSPPGPLAMWAAAARAGDEVALLGPDRPGSGRLWGAEWAPPPSARRVLVAGDETAVPAIGAIVEGLPAHASGIVLAEVPTRADVPAWTSPAGVDVRWLVRDGDAERSPRGRLLEQAAERALAAFCDGQAVQDCDTWAEEGPDDALLWDVPEPLADPPGELYVWMAGEAGVMKRLRRLARQRHALPRSSVACMGYWRQGRPEPA